MDADNAPRDLSRRSDRPKWPGARCDSATSGDARFCDYSQNTVQDVFSDSRFRVWNGLVQSARTPSGATRLEITYLRNTIQDAFLENKKNTVLHGVLEIRSHIHLSILTIRAVDGVPFAFSAKSM